MKIVQIINSLGTGGAEKLLIDTIPKYIDAGITVDLLVLWDNDHLFLQQLKAMNICTIHVLNTSQDIKDVYKLQNIIKLKKLLQGYDIAHVHLFPAQYFVPLAKMLGNLKIPLLFTEHSTSNRRIRKTWMRPLERFIYKKYEKLICISPEIKTIYQSYLRVADDYFEIIANGVDIQAIHNAKSIAKEEIAPGIQERDTLLMQVAAFRAEKDQATLVRAMQYLPAPFKLIFVGDGVTRTATEQLAITLGLEKRVFFLGQRMDVQSLLKSVDIVVMSTMYEGVSLSCIEAMASGKPFIASDVKGVHEMVQGAGLLFPQGDAEALARQINHVVQDAALAAQTVEACQLRANEYGIEQMIEKHIELYNRVYGKNKNY